MVTLYFIGAAPGAQTNKGNKKRAKPNRIKNIIALCIPAPIYYMVRGALTAVIGCAGEVTKANY